MILVFHFRRQVLAQCHFIITAGRGLDLVVRSQPRVFYAIQDLLNAAANFSKALWGAGGRAADRRRRLRDDLAVTDRSLLLEANMRNDFGHFDERLERWYEPTTTHHNIDMNFGQVREFIAGI